MSRVRSSRSGRIARLRSEIERQQYPRLQMMIIVLLTGTAGFIASVVMLHFGVTTMALRYFLALCIAYAMFLFIIWVWLRWGADSGDIVDIADPGGWAGPQPSAPGYSGHGGTFDGGGASANYDSSSALSDGGGKVLDGVDVDIGDAGIPLAVAALIAGVVFCALFIVYSAPLLFAELLVDGLLSASLYRRLRGLERHHWLQTALRRTVWPFVFAAVSVIAIGVCLSMYTPGAHSIGEAIKGHARTG